MARIKPQQNIQPVRTAEEANEALKELGELKRITADIENRMNDDLALIKTGAAQEAAPHNSRRAALENGLMAYAEANKDILFKDRRSVKFDYGELGYRRSAELAPKKGSTWKKILGRLKELAFTDAVRVKEEPDKEAMSQWPDERLELVDCERRQKDTFWFELDEEKLAALP